MLGLLAGPFFSLTGIKAQKPLFPPKYTSPLDDRAQAPPMNEFTARLSNTLYVVDDWVLGLKRVTFLLVEIHTLFHTSVRMLRMPSPVMAHKWLTSLN